MFYIFDEDRIDENGLFITEYDNGCHKGELTLVKYDFKTDDSLLLDTRDGKVMCVKMWRKGDFDRLCQWIKTKEFDFIQVEQCLWCTIADLESSVNVRQHHIMEAIGYRNLDRSSYFNM